MRWRWTHLRHPALAAATIALCAAALLPGAASRAQDAVRSASAPSAMGPQKPPEPPDLALVRDAVAAYRKGDLAAGDTIRARVETAGAKAFLDWAAIRLGGPTVPFDRVLGFMTGYPDYPGQPWLRRRGEEALLVERKPAATVRAYFSRERPQTAAGKFALAQAFRADGLPEDADALVREAWRTDTFGRDLELRILDAFKDTLTTADHRFRMERFLLREGWDGARRAASYAGPGYDALVKARIAVDDRAKTAPKLLDAVPAGLKSDTSWLFSRVQNLRRAEKTGEVTKLMADLSRDPAALVDGDVWWVERRLIGRKLLEDGDPKGAYEVVTGHGAASNERRIEAEFLAGWIALRSMRDPAAARRHFDRAASLSGMPVSLARAAYWQGRAAEAGGRPDDAKVHYAAAARQATTYYGMLAAAKMGVAEVGLRLAGGPDRREPAKTPLVEAVATAYAAGIRELGLPLAVEFGRGSTNLAELDAVSATLTGAGDARALLTLGKLATQRGLPLDEAAFPTFGVPPYEIVGRRVEPAMVLAIARQESAFDPAAGSSVGARGLMQLMPGTALATAKKAGLTYEPDRILEANYNAQLGAAHLGDLMEDWKGSFILTFASYNAGPGNVKKWIVANGDPRAPGVDAVDWVERIPFSETRNYVQRVMENLQVYRKRLDDRSPLLIDSDLKAGSPTGNAAASATP